MGKVKKGSSNNKKSNSPAKVLKGITKNKTDKKKGKKLGAFVTSTKKALKILNDVDSNEFVSVKATKNELSKRRKLPKSKAEDILISNEALKVSKKEIKIKQGKGKGKTKKNLVKDKVVNVQVASNGVQTRKSKLGKSNESPGVKKTTSFKNKAKALKVKTGLIFNQKSYKTDETSSDTITSNIQEDSVRSGIKVIFNVIEKTRSDKSLFEDQAPIFLQFSTFKIAKTPSRTLRIPLKHSLLTESSEVCLFSDDLRGHPRKEFEKTIEHYENLLKDKGVTNIKTIMPFYQLKNEYSEFELKRKLVELYDVFLVDAKITGYTVKKLGKIFMDKRKLPIPIRLDANNLKDVIDFALRKTSTNIHPHGDNFTIQIAHSEMSEDQIYENFQEACTILSKEFPGGWDNIRALKLKTPKSFSIPVYYTLKNPSEVPVPVVKPKRPKAFKAVTGELSTIYDREVKVLPSGTVTLKKQPSRKALKVGGNSAVSNGVEKDDSCESDEEFQRMYKKLEKSPKKVIPPRTQIKEKVGKKRGREMKARNAKLNSKVSKKAQLAAKNKKSKTKLKVANKQKKGGDNKGKKLKGGKKNKK